VWARAPPLRRSLGIRSQLSQDGKSRECTRRDCSDLAYSSTCNHIFAFGHLKLFIDVLLLFACDHVM
jgi:hypothetical protein